MEPLLTQVTVETHTAGHWSGPTSAYERDTPVAVVPQHWLQGYIALENCCVSGGAGVATVAATNRIGHAMSGAVGRESHDAYARASRLSTSQRKK